MRRAALAWLGCVLASSGCGARSGIELGQWSSSGGDIALSTNSGGSLNLGGSAVPERAGAGNDGASHGGASGAAAGALQGTAGAPLALKPAFATAISAGTNMACALMSDNSVRCWGSNDFGQLGDGTTSTPSSTLPVRVRDVDSATAIATGGTWTSGGKGAASSAYACAVLKDGSVKCWGKFPGRPYFSDADPPAPTTIGGVSDARAIAGGNWHACALQASGSVQCWGDGSQGELGTGFITDCKPWSCSPDTVGTKPVTADISGAIAISGQGSEGSCAVVAPNAVECWGSFVVDIARTPAPFLVANVTTTAKGLSAGYDHACAVTPSGGVQCWRRDAQPTIVDGIAGHAIAVSVGRTHTCALLEDTTVECWLEPTASPNDTSEVRSRTPTRVPDLSNVIAVSAGYGQTCALISGGSVRCWGLGFGSAPRLIAGLN